jgi:hypothetical protein
MSRHASIAHTQATPLSGCAVVAHARSRMPAHAHCGSPMNDDAHGDARPGAAGYPHDRRPILMPTLPPTCVAMPMQRNASGSHGQEGKRTGRQAPGTAPKTRNPARRPAASATGAPTLLRGVAPMEMTTLHTPLPLRSDAAGAGRHPLPWEPSAAIRVLRDFLPLQPTAMEHMPWKTLCPRGACPTDRELPAPSLAPCRAVPDASATLPGRDAAPTNFTPRSGRIAAATPVQPMNDDDTTRVAATFRNLRRSCVTAHLHRPHAQSPTQKTSDFAYVPAVHPPLCTPHRNGPARPATGVPNAGQPSRRPGRGQHPGLPHCRPGSVDILRRRSPMEERS